MFKPLVIIKSLFFISVIGFFSYLIYDYKKSKEQISDYKILIDGLSSDIILLEDSLNSKDLTIEKIIKNRDEIIESLNKLNENKKVISDKINAQKQKFEIADVSSEENLGSALLINKSINDIFGGMFND